MFGNYSINLAWYLKIAHLITTLYLDYGQVLRNIGFNLMGSLVLTSGERTYKTDGGIKITKA